MYTARSDPQETSYGPLSSSGNSSAAGFFGRSQRGAGKEFSPSGIFYGETSQSEFGADVTYSDRYIARVRPEPEPLPPPALRRSISSRTGDAWDSSPSGLSSASGPRPIKRRVSWSQNTADHMSQSQRNLKSLGQRVEQKQPKATPSCLNHLLAYLNVYNGSCGGGAHSSSDNLSGDGAQDEVTNRMRRSMSSRGQDIDAVPRPNNSPGGVYY